MLNGIHAHNRYFSDGPDATVYRIGGFRSVKLMWYHGPQEVDALRRHLPDVRLLVRLQDTGPYRDNLARGQDAWAETIRKFQALGVHDFQADNEPNLQWQWASKPWIWRWYQEQMLLNVPALAGGEVRFGLTPLSWAPDHWSTLGEWREMLTWHDPAAPGHRSLAQLCDFAVCNSYWQSERQMGDPSFGRNFEDLFGSTGLPVVLGEYGSSLCMQEPKPPVREVQDAMQAQYPVYLAGLPNYVVSAHLFIAGGNWAGFVPEDRVVRAVACR